jgi:hypothetical protein
VLEVRHFTNEEFKPLAESAHMIAFAESRSPDDNTYDFALLTVESETERPVLYATFFEQDSKFLYIQTGGVLPVGEDAPRARQSFSVMLEWCAERYEDCSLQVNNTNIAMQKLALNLDFVVNGVSHWGKSTMVHFYNNLQKYRNEKLTQGKFWDYHKELEE